MKTIIKNVMNTLVTTALVAVLIFAGFVAGIKRKELVKLYEYGRYLTMTEEQVETKEVNHGRLMSTISLEKEIFR